jgi:dephospho-CoA kinase
MPFSIVGFRGSQPRMIVVGICGLPAGGKSAVAGMLQTLGAVWINADTIAHEVLERPEVKTQVVRRFGTAICRSDGKIDRPRLAAIVFGDDASSRAALKYLESVVHPQTQDRMIEEIAAAVRSGAPVIVLDVPLLLESEWDLWCDEVWYVDTAEATRLTAAANRGWTAEALNRRAARQLDGDEKRRRSTRTIDNHGSLEHLKFQIETWWEAAVTADQLAPTSSHCQDRLQSSAKT